MNKNFQRPDIHEIFKMLGLEHKEDRVRLTFGASTLEDTDNELFKTIHIVKTPDGVSLKGMK
jgi:hypothetical protein